MRLIFGKAHVKGHYRTDPTTHAQVYVKPHEDGREAGADVRPKEELTIDKALRSLGMDPNAPMDKAKALRRKADKLAKEAMAMTERIPGGQPIHSTADRNLRERSMEKHRKAIDLIKQAEAIEEGAAKSKESPSSAVDTRDFSKKLQELQKQLTETKSVKGKLRLLDHGIEITTAFIENAKAHRSVTPDRLSFYQDWLKGIQESRDRLAAATLMEEEPWQIVQGQFQNIILHRDDYSDGGIGGSQEQAKRSVNEFYRMAKLGGESRLSFEHRMKESDVKAWHKKLVGAALAAGKPVPTEVLADYPDLFPQEQMSLFKALRSKLSFWFGKIFAKSHVKTYTRSDGVVVREHNDKRRSSQPDEKHPRGPAKEKVKKGRRKAGEEESPKPYTTAQPEYPKVEPPEEGELAAWIEQIMQEPDILAAMEEVDGAMPTDKIYKTETGEYQPDRAKLHQSIVASMLNPRAVPEEGQRPHAVIFMGRPASGKTTALGPAAKELGVEFTVINADDVKEKLPEYNRRNAGVVHEESSDIAEGQLLPQALDAGHHLLLDITGANVGKVRKLVETFHQLGYEISVMMADLPIEKAVARAVNRFRNPGNGRFVPPRYIVENVDHKPEKTYDAMKSDPRVAHWRRYNNDVEAGEKAPLKDQGSKDVAGNPFHKGGQFDARGDISRPEGIQSFRGDGREPERPHASRARQSSEEVQGHATGPVDPSLLRAYEVRDTLTKSIHHLNIDLDSPEIAADVRGTLLSQRLGHHTRLERLNDLIEKAEYATC